MNRSISTSSEYSFQISNDGTRLGCDVNGVASTSFDSQDSDDRSQPLHGSWLSPNDNSHGTTPSKKRIHSSLTSHTSCVLETAFTPTCAKAPELDQSALCPRTPSSASTFMESSMWLSNSTDRNVSREFDPPIMPSPGKRTTTKTQHRRSQYLLLGSEFYLLE